MNVNKTVVVEKAIDAIGNQWGLSEADRFKSGVRARALVMLAQLDCLPNPVDPIDPLTWDEQGLPK